MEVFEGRRTETHQVERRRHARTGTDRARHHNRRATDRPAIRETAAAADPTLTLGRTLLAADSSVAVAGWATAVSLSGGGPWTHTSVFVLAAALTAVVALRRARARTTSPTDGGPLGGGAIMAAAATSTLVAAAAGPALDLSIDLSTAPVAGAVIAVALTLTALAARDRVRTLTARGRIERSVALVGTDASAQSFAAYVREHPILGYRLDVIVDPSPSRDEEATRVHRLRDLGDADRALELLTGRVVFVALEGEPSAATRYLLDRLLDQGIAVRGWVPFLDRANTVTVSRLGGATNLRATVRRSNRAELAAKRAIDASVAAVLLLAVAPILAWAAWRVHREDGGPSLFRQRRIGRLGEPFEMLKLRTMVEDSDERLVDLTFDNERSGGPLFKLADDPRRTRIGHTLERLSLDELPQLWNVLRGDMSLVGPRPALPHEVDTFDPGLLRRHAVTPGITGLWQLTARDDPSFAEYRRLDLLYVEQWSVALDARIFFRTIVAVGKRAVRTRTPRRVDPEPIIDLTAEPT